MPPFHSSFLASFALPIALAGCGEANRVAEAALEPDPAIVAALSAPIMTDPDLAAMNRGNAAIEIGIFDGVPAWSQDPEEIAAARSAAARLAGGQLRAAPEAAGEPESVSSGLTAKQFAAGLTGTPSSCLTALRTGFAWADNLPAASALYPGAHVEEAAGARLPTCALRAARYVTSGTPGDVLDFHFSLLSAAGYEVDRASGEGVDLLSARKGGAVARVLVERGPGGMTRVALATSI